VADEKLATRLMNPVRLSARLFINEVSRLMEASVLLLTLFCLVAILAIR
jgi:hypothetical protein